LIGIGIRCSLEILRRRSPAVDDGIEAAFEAAPHTTIDLGEGLSDGKWVTEFDLRYRKVE
jgi:hypothetical protein